MTRPMIVNAWSRRGLLQMVELSGLLACLAGLAACRNHTQKPASDGSVSDTSDLDGSVPIEISDSSVRISTAFNECPVVALTASPAVARVGGHVAVGVRAADADLGDHLTYAWTASAGTLASASASDTTYICPGLEKAGPETITVAVSDGKCTVTRSATINCVAVGDAGNPGGTGGRGAGGSDGGGAADGGPGGTGGSAACPSNDPTRCEGDVCNQCTFGVGPSEIDVCTDTTSGCHNCYIVTDGCDADEHLNSDALRGTCMDLYACMRDSHCTQAGATTSCWTGYPAGSPEEVKVVTGTLPASGPCVTQVVAAAGSSDPSVINLRFIDPAFPIGRAVNLAACRSNFCGKLVDSEHPSCPGW